MYVDVYVCGCMWMDLGLEHLSGRGEGGGERQRRTSPDIQLTVFNTRCTTIHHHRPFQKPTCTKGLLKARRKCKSRVQNGAMARVAPASEEGLTCRACYRDETHQLLDVFLQRRHGGREIVAHKHLSGVSRTDVKSTAEDAEAAPLLWHARTHTHARTRAHTRAHARTHARTRTNTRTHLLLAWQ